MRKNRRFVCKNVLVSVICLLSALVALSSCGNLFTDNTKNTPPAEPKKTIGSSAGTVLFTGTVTDILPKSGAVPADIARLVSSDDAYGRYAMPTKPTSGISYTVTAKTDEKAANGTDPLKTANGVVSTSDGVTYSIPLATGYKWIITVTMKATVDDSSVDVLSDSFTMQTPLSAGSVLSHDFCLKPLPSGKGGIDLSMSAKSDLGINSVVVKGLPSTDETLSLNNGVFRLNKEKVAAGVYDVTLLFKNSNKLVYYTTQTINVFPNLTTDKWVSDGSSGPINNGTFAVTKQLVQAYMLTNIYVGDNDYTEVDASDNNSGTPYAPLETLGAALSYIQSTGNSNKDYTIHVSGEHKGNFTLGDGLNGKAKSLTLCGMTSNTTDILNGDTNNDGMGDGSVLTITTTVPITIRNLKITGGKAQQGGGINALTTEAKITLESGALITDNTAEIQGGGMYVYGAKNTLVMNEGAKISENHVTEERSDGGYGGVGIYFGCVNTTAVSNRPEFTMNGGEISDHTSNMIHKGIGLRLDRAKLVMNGGKITRNSGISEGGNISSEGASVIEIKGGEISYGSIEPTSNRTANAGAIYLQNTQMTMTGGKIINNSVTPPSGKDGNGGAILVHNNASLIITGGEISGNYVSTSNGGNAQGGAIHVAVGGGAVKIGGDAYIPEGANGEHGLGKNDIVLCEGKTITILSVFNKPGTVATVIPGKYEADYPVVEKDDDVSAAVFAAACEKIAVTDGKYHIEPVTNEDGTFGVLKLGINTTAENAADAIGRIVASETVVPVKVTGEISEDQVNGIENAISSLPDNVLVSLDLSGATLTGGTGENISFNGNTKLKSISLPVGMEKLKGTATNDQGTFYNCSELTSITLPESLKSTGVRAFVGTKIKTIDIPAGVTTIGIGAFNQCSLLESITIPGSVTSIGEQAFYVCNSLTTVTFENSATALEIGNNAFNNNVTTVYFNGTETQKNDRIPQDKIGSGNNKLTEATWNYTFVPVTGMNFKSLVTVGEGTDAASKVFVGGTNPEVVSMFVCDHEVTQKEWYDIMRVTQSEMFGGDKGIGDNYPVYYVNWYDAIIYCNKRSMAEGFTPFYSVGGETDPSKWDYTPYYVTSGTPSSEEVISGDYISGTIECISNANGYRLPTEAEWEYIARGGNGLTGMQHNYSGNDSITDVAWYSGNSTVDDVKKAHEVKTKAANGGIYDMTGNVWEWCYDMDSQSKRAVRGGSAGCGSNASAGCYVSYQTYDSPDQHKNDVGFRVVRTAPATDYPITDTYSVTFDSDGGTAVTSQFVKKDNSASAPAAPTKSGYEFLGWYNGSSKYNFSSAVTANISLTAKWCSTAGFVSVNGNGGNVPNMYVCDHEVTQKEFSSIMGVSQAQLPGYDPDEGTGTGDNYPVYYVKWYHAIAYCNKRSAMEGLECVYSVNGITDWKNLAYSSIPTSSNSVWNAAQADTTKNGYRLPTSAEWEYAAREGKSSGFTYSGSNSIDAVAWYEGNASSSHEVKTKTANALGIYDMSGNVSEWCWDSTTNSDGDFARVIRGGGWNDGDQYCAVSRSDCNEPHDGGWDKGFRVFRTRVAQ